MTDKNPEKYISFNINVTVGEYKSPLGETKQIKRQLLFIDSVRFMGSSLDTLSRNLVRLNGMVCIGYGSKVELTHINENYVTHGMCGKCRGPSHQKLEIDPIFDNLRSYRGTVPTVAQKGAYPYEYMDNWEKFEEKCLSPIEAFYSRLNLLGIRKCDYNHAQRLWGVFGMKNLGDYHDLYLETDMLLLCNIFETFRMTFLEHYALSPTHFFTSPGLAWQDCIKKTEVSLELLTDCDMLLMFK